MRCRIRIGGLIACTMELDGSNVGPVSESQPKDVKARVKQEPIDPVVLPKGQRTGTTGTAIRGEPIAPNLGVDYAFPPHLEYAYPPPDGNILTNIVNALIAVPRFYTQLCLTRYCIL